MAAPLIWYYVITIVISLLNGAAADRQFAGHAVVVAILPLALMAIAAAVLAVAP